MRKNTSYSKLEVRSSNFKDNSSTVFKPKDSIFIRKSFRYESRYFLLPLKACCVSYLRLSAARGANLVLRASHFDLERR